MFPTHHGEAAVWLIRPSSPAGTGAGRRCRPVPKRHSWPHCRSARPTWASGCGPARVTAPVRGSVGLPNHLRRAGGPGWALVGDAGYHRDPISGHGITDALRDADLLAAAADRMLRDPADEAVAMTAYGQQRNDAVRDTFRITRELAEFPHPRRFAQAAARPEQGAGRRSPTADLAARPAVGLRQSSALLRSRWMGVQTAWGGGTPPAHG